MTEKSVDELIADLWHIDSTPLLRLNFGEDESSSREKVTEALVSSIAVESAKKAAAKNRKCPHGKRLSLCKECGGEYLCQHGRVKRQCKHCGGASMCIHKRRIPLCKECGGSALCEHGRQKRQCKLCEVKTGTCSCPTM